MRITAAATAYLREPEALEDRLLPSTPYADLPVLPALDPATLANVRRIAAVGDQNGLRDDAFFKVGDSNSFDPAFLQRIGSSTYNPVTSGLAAYGPDVLQTWLKYRSPVSVTGENSFERTGFAAVAGSNLFRMRATVGHEMAATRGGVALILAGTNDHWHYDAALFRGLLGQLVDELTAAGVVPVLSTIPWDRFAPGHDHLIAAYNQAIADFADERKLPVVNLWRALEPLPNAGLKTGNHPLARDFRHLSSSPDSGRFLPADLLHGQNVRNLLTLQVLTQLRQQVFERPADAPTETWSALAPGQAVYAAGSVYGGTVTVFDADTGRPTGRLVPYGAGFAGGVNVAVGDVNADGVADVVTAPATRGGPHVRAFSGADGRELFGFFALDPSFRGGVSVAVGDADGDGANDVVVGAGPGGGPVVRVFRASDRAVTREFLAFEPSFRGGVSVAAGVFAGRSGVAVGAGPGGAPVVRVFDGATGELVSAFAAYGIGLRSGVSIAAGDFDGDGDDEVIAGPGAGGAPHVRIFDPADGTEKFGFFAGSATESTGLTVGAVRQAGSPHRVVTGTRGPHSQPVRLWSVLGEALAAAAVGADPNLFNGSFVGG